MADLSERAPATRVAGLSLPALPVLPGLLDRWHRHRVLAAHQRMARRREPLLHWLDGVDAGTFARNGFLIRRQVLPPAAFEALRGQLLARLANHPGRVQVDAPLRQALPALAPLLEGRAWNGLTRYVAGVDRCAPVWAEAAEHTRPPAARAGPRDVQTLLHTDAWRSRMKAWYFLTDVEDDDAPLCYVPGSHRLTPHRLRWEQRRGDAGARRVEKLELEDLGLGRPVRFVVPANTLIVADAFGFHKRAQPRRRGVRLEITASQ